MKAPDFVHQMMSSPVLHVAPDDSVADALRAMIDRDIGAVVVADDGRPVGVFTERDVSRSPLSRTIDWSGSSRSGISSGGSMRSPPSDASTAAVDLYWIPLGAGGHIVKLNGRVYEAIKALAERRPRYALYHTALEISVPSARFVIESAPIRDDRGPERGVVGEGPVGTRWLGRSRLFRYEIRLWPGGSIPDASEAVSSPVRVSNDRATADHIVEMVPSVPMLVWGRDELRTGDMWNSNSLISWLLARVGVDTTTLQPPAGGRAPGWNAGLELARRQIEMSHSLPLLFGAT